MNNQNQTSLAAARILYYIEENDVITWHDNADKHLREILQRFDRMQTALQQITDPATPVWKIAKIAEEALLFDPLRS